MRGPGWADHRSSVPAGQSPVPPPPPPPCGKCHVSGLWHPGGRNRNRIEHHPPPAPQAPDPQACPSPSASLSVPSRKAARLEAKALGAVSTAPPPEGTTDPVRTRVQPGCTPAPSLHSPCQLILWPQFPLLENRVWGQDPLSWVAPRACDAAPSHAHRMHTLMSCLSAFSRSPQSLNADCGHSELLGPQKNL